MRIRSVGTAICLGLVLSLPLKGQPATGPTLSQGPIEVLGDGYVSSRSCQSCHPRNYASWYGSYHRTMTRIPTPENVLAPFKDTRLQLHGSTYRLDQRDREFWVTLPQSLAGAEATESRRRIVLMTGSHHAQVYWLASGNRRKIEILPFIYHLGQKRWMPEKASFLAPPTTTVSTRAGEWNVVCVKCHVTRGRPRIASADDMDSQAAEFGIACEACHGPAESHVRFHEQTHNPSGPDGLTEDQAILVHPGGLDHRRASQVCGQCHSSFALRSHELLMEWLNHGFRFQPGQDLTETRIIVNRRMDRSDPVVQRYLASNPRALDSMFWSDGMVRVAGREYNGLIDSPCFQRGTLSCLSCHQLHQQKNDPRPLEEWANDQLRNTALGNGACLQCHTTYADRIQQHTRHLPHSSGSQCYNCHMPFTSYGLLKAIRSHQIDSPTVEVSLATGRPNACNQCHLDRTLAWTAQHLQDWFGKPKPHLDPDEESIAAGVLWTLRGDAGQRALMAWSMGWDQARQTAGQDWLAPYLAQLLNDPYDAVRFIAHRSLRSLPGFGDFDYDFVGPEKDRAAAARRATNLWERNRDSQHGASRNAILMDSTEGLDQDSFRRLLKQRNEQPVTLAE